MPSKEQRKGDNTEQSSSSEQVQSRQPDTSSNSTMVEQISQEMPQVSASRVNLPSPVAPDGHRNYYIDRDLDFVVRYSNNPVPPDYYMDYGDKYITRFSDETNDLLTSEGQAWLGRARINLQVAIESEREASPLDYDSLEKDNDSFRSFAMGTHADAYWNAGLGALSLFDLAHVALSPDAKDLLSLDGVKQSADIGVRLLGLWGENAVDYAMGEGTTEELVNAMYEGYALVGDGIDEVFGQGTASALEKAADELGLEAQDLFEDAYYVVADVIEGGAGFVDGVFGAGTVEGALDSGREAAQDIITGVETAYDWAASFFD